MKKRQIEEKIEQILKEYQYFLIDFVIRGDNRHRILEVYVDNESGVSTDDCAKISHEISSFIDEEEILTNYRLDVSSPGLGRPLKFIQQFPKHLNRKFKISYTNNNDVLNLTGILLKVEGNVLTFKAKKEETEIDFNNIKTAKIEISF